MSYILEALKKSDQKRKLGNVPDLNADHVVLKKGAQKNQRPWWFFTFLAGIVLVNFFLWMVWWGPWWHGDEKTLVEQHDLELPQPHKVQPETDVDVDVGGIAVNQSEPTAGRIIHSGAEPEVAPLTTRPVDSVAEAELSGELDIMPKKQSPPRAPAETVLVEAAVPGTSAPLVQSPAPEIEVLLKNDLPESVQDDLPELNISLHFFSNKPTARLVRINDYHMREGDVLGDNLRLVEITKDGVVLEFLGYKFRMDKW